MLKCQLKTLYAKWVLQKRVIAVWPFFSTVNSLPIFRYFSSFIIWSLLRIIYLLETFRVSVLLEDGLLSLVGKEHENRKSFIFHFLNFFCFVIVMFLELCCM